MRKHLLRLIIAYTCFELFRRIGGELPEWFRGEEIFTWIRNKKFVIFSVANLFIFMLYPVVSFIIFQRFFRTQKKKAIIYFLIACFSIITIRYLVEEILFLYLLGFHNYYAGVPLLYYYVDNIYYAVVYSAFGIVYYLLQNEQRRKLEHHQLTLENQQAQLSFLRSQINPHFLFNNLNNIYSLVYQKSENSLQAISGLSDILRYMLYENHEKVSLAKELDYIQKYIELQQLRFEKPPHVQQIIDADLESTCIPPLLLIPFVENAFKHGDLKHDGVHLQMKIKTTAKTIDFSLSNKKTNAEKDMLGGIGLQNIRRRLELLYPGRHTLDITDSNDTFTVTLELVN